MKEWDLSKLYQSFDDSSFTTDLTKSLNYKNK